MNPVLSLHSLTRRFPRTSVPAVNAVDFTMEVPRIVALTGESGCGKTTTLRMIAGFETPDTGSITLAGREICGPGPASWVPPEKRRIGMVFQDHSLFPHLTVGQNIGFGLPRGKKSARGRDRIETMLSMMGLEGLSRRYPHEISGGQRQRVALARALAPEPQLLLMDEAFNNLDARLKQRLLPEIRRTLKAAGTPTLLVTHDCHEAFELADRILVMRNGVVVQDGTPRELYEFPANSYVAEFFGETNHLSLGAERFIVRPENIRLLAEADRESAPDKESLTAAGRIQDLRYRGDIHEIRILLGPSSPPLGEGILVAHARKSPVHSPGQAVGVEISRRDLVRVE